jgi:hypothetical protein
MGEEKRQPCGYLRSGKTRAGARSLVSAERVLNRRVLEEESSAMGAGLRR